MKQRGRNLSEKRHHLKWTVRGSKSVRLDRFMIDSLAWKSRRRSP